MMQEIKCVWEYYCLLFFFSSTIAILACFWLCRATFFFYWRFNRIILEKCCFIYCSTLRCSCYLEGVFLFRLRLYLHNRTWHILSINIGVLFCCLQLSDWNLLLFSLDRSLECCSLLKLWLDEDNFIG